MAEKINIDTIPNQVTGTASSVMNVDFTNASVNRKSAQVLVIASPSEDAALYIGREKNLTFYSYGNGHQECTQHDIRYLIGSGQNEPELDVSTVSKFEAEYDIILEKAETKKMCTKKF